MKKNIGRFFSYWMKKENDFIFLQRLWNNHVSGVYQADKQIDIYNLLFAK